MDEDVTTRLVTQSELDADPPSLRVSWIQWDSGFRGSGLVSGDRIVAVDGQPVTPPAEPRERSLWESRSVGRYAEAQAWAAAGKRAGDPVTLTVRRRAFPVGWRMLSVTGTLRPQTRYTTPDGRLAIGAGGPDWLESDGFQGGWGGWYEREIVPPFSAVLDDGWGNPSFASRYELSQHHDRQERVAYLVQHYPGPFAAALQADFEAVLASLQGVPIVLDAQALRYRVAEEERAQRVREQAQAAWSAFRTAIADSAIPAFPAIHPIRGDRDRVTGKHVILPPLRNRDWIGEAGHTWFVAGSQGDGWYFADGEDANAGLLLDALGRYRRLVAPNIDETYTLVGRITGAPRQLVIRDDAYFGLQIELVAGLIGDSLFVDLTRARDGVARFAGEESFDQPAGALPPADATPAAVMTAAITALKEGDQRLWEALFTPWAIYHVGDRPVVRAYAERNTNREWESSRRAILGTVFDARVAWTDEPRLILAGTDYPGAPRVEEVEVRLELIGQFDGEYRVFANGVAARRWQLQRLDGGPWRIATAQSL